MNSRALLCSLLGALVALVFTSSVGAEPRGVSEYKLRSVMLFKIAKFVEWPADAFDDANSPLLLCIVGSESVARDFKSLEKQKHASRAISVRRMQGDTTDLQRCHIAYFQSIEVVDLTYTLRKLHSSPVLAVGESKEFLDAGGSVALLSDAGRVTFLVNNAAAKANGLHVNSQLLHIADRMRHGQ